MKTHRLHIRVFLFLVGSTCLLGQIASAQDFRARVSNMKQRLSDIEGSLAKIERSSTIEADSTLIASMIDAHAEEARAAFNLAMADLRTYNSSNGAQGSLDKAKEFEALIQDQKAAAEKAFLKMSEIDASIRIGKVKIATPVLQRMTPNEMLEFRRSLKPDVDKEYKRSLPNIFIGSVTHLTDAEWASAQKTFCGACSTKPTRQSSGLQRLMDSIETSAQASPALAAGCYSICAASFGTACATCIIGAGSAAVAAYNWFVAGRNSCCRCRWYKPWCCACRAYYWSVFLAAIA